MISIIRLTIDIPIEHHAYADKTYLENVVSESIFNQQGSARSTDEKKSYRILLESNRYAKVLPDDINK